MANYINEQGETYNGISVVVDGKRYIAPSEAKLLELGYHKMEEPNYELTEADVRSSRMEEIRKLLFKEDFKVIKNSEAAAAGVPLPYEPTALHEARQALRDEYNTLEAQEGGEQ